MAADKLPAAVWSVPREHSGRAPLPMQTGIDYTSWQQLEAANPALVRKAEIS